MLNNIFTFSNFFIWEDFLVLTFVYIFFKFIILTSVLELIWPTHYFNRKNNIGFQSFRLRTYTETILKLRSFYFFNNFLFFMLYVYFF